MKFRTLDAGEIECRIGSISEKGCSLLLYKDARADMNLLDETVGPENWQRSHELINGNLFCNVSIYCNEEWVTKQDVGKESYTEAEKGQASDAFKRACTNWGIGRELYTAPFIWLTPDVVKIEDKGGKKITNDRFKVSSISYDDRRNITALVIKNSKTNRIVYRYGYNDATVEPATATTPEAQPTSDAVALAEARAKVMKYVNDKGMSKENIQKICKLFEVSSLNELSLEHCNHYMTLAQEKEGKTA